MFNIFVKCLQLYNWLKANARCDLHVTVACCCHFLGNENYDAEDNSDEDDDDDDEDDDDMSDENDGIRSFDELISGFISGKTPSLKMDPYPTP